MLKRVDAAQAAQVRSTAQKDLLFFKVARWAIDKGWPESLEAAAQLRAAGYDLALLARGNDDEDIGD